MFAEQTLNCRSIYQTGQKYRTDCENAKIGTPYIPIIKFNVTTVHNKYIFVHIYILTFT